MWTTEMLHSYGYYNSIIIDIGIEELLNVCDTTIDREYVTGHDMPVFDFLTKLSMPGQSANASRVFDVIVASCKKKYPYDTTVMSELKKVNPEYFNPSASTKILTIVNTAVLNKTMIPEMGFGWMSELGSLLRKQAKPITYAQLFALIKENEHPNLVELVQATVYDGLSTNNLNKTIEAETGLQWMLELNSFLRKQIKTVTYVSFILEINENSEEYPYLFELLNATKR